MSVTLEATLVKWRNAVGSLFLNQLVMGWIWTLGTR